VSTVETAHARLRPIDSRRYGVGAPRAAPWSTVIRSISCPASSICVSVRRVPLDVEHAQRMSIGDHLDDIVRVFHRRRCVHFAGLSVNVGVVEMLPAPRRSRYKGYRPAACSWRPSKRSGRL